MVKCSFNCFNYCRRTSIKDNFEFFKSFSSVELDNLIFFPIKEFLIFLYKFISVAGCNFNMKLIFLFCFKIFNEKFNKLNTSSSNASGIIKKFFFENLFKLNFIFFVLGLYKPILIIFCL